MSARERYTIVKHAYGSGSKKTNTDVETRSKTETAGGSRSYRYEDNEEGEQNSGVTAQVKKTTLD